MSLPITFIPKYSHPFTLEQAVLLEIDLLVGEIRRLENSISHLRETQSELNQFLRDEPDGDGDGEVGKAKAENDEVISSQTERITLIKIALLNKVGEGGVRHYGFDPPSPTPTSLAPPPSHTSLAPQPAPDNGLYL